MKQPSTIPHWRALLTPLFALGFAHSASAQDERSAPTKPPATDAAAAMRTGKERLGEKWTDERRIDNCNVPIDKRGTKPRPSDCPSDSPGTNAGQDR